MITLLTDLSIRGAKPAAKAYTLKDGAGLYLNVKHNGTKQWLFRFYWEGTQKRISFGVYPDVNLKKARSLGQQAQDLIASGIDPPTGRKSIIKPEAKVLRNRLTFAEYAQTWKEQRVKREKDAKVPDYLVPLPRQAVDIIKELLACRFLA